MSFLERLKKYNAQASRSCASPLIGESGDKGWVTAGRVRIASRWPPELVEECLEALRKVQTNGQVQLAVSDVAFCHGL